MTTIVTGIVKSFNYKFHIIIITIMSYICDGVDSNEFTMLLTPFYYLKLFSKSNYNISSLIYATHKSQ